MTTRARRRRRQHGQALLMALVTLVIASIAAALVAADLTLRERAMRAEAVRTHLRTMLDGELATALGRLAASQAQPSGRRQWAGGEVAADRDLLGAGRYRITVWASYTGRDAAVLAEVHRPPHGTPVVTGWRRLAAAETPPLPP